MVLDCQILDGNPSDSNLATNAVERHQEIFAKVPRQVAFDGCFASKASPKEIKKLGTKIRGDNGCHLLAARPVELWRRLFLYGN